MSLYIQDEAALALMSFSLGAVLGGQLMGVSSAFPAAGAPRLIMDRSGGHFLLDLLCSHDLFLIVLGEQRRGTGVRHWLCAFIYDGLRQNCQQECIVSYLKKAGRWIKMK